MRIFGSVYAALCICWKAVLDSLVQAFHAKTTAVCTDTALPIFHHLLTRNFMDQFSHYNFKIVKVEN